MADDELPNKDVWHLAQTFTIREMVIDYLKLPLDLDDLQALMAYRPWKSDEKERIYWNAVETGRIEAPRHVDDTTATKLMSELSRHASRFFPLVIAATLPVFVPGDQTLTEADM